MVQLETRLYALHVVSTAEESITLRKKTFTSAGEGFYLIF